MPLKKKVTSLELSKKLHKAGIIIKTCCIWHKDGSFYPRFDLFGQDLTVGTNDYFSACLTIELLKYLWELEEVEIEEIVFFKEGLRVNGVCDELLIKKIFKSKNPADSLAKACLWLQKQVKEKL